jgi:hypothetical protein
MGAALYLALVGVTIRRPGASISGRFLNQSRLNIAVDIRPFWFTVYVGRAENGHELS